MQPCPKSVIMAARKRRHSHAEYRADRSCAGGRHHRHQGGRRRGRRRRCRWHDLRRCVRPPKSSKAGADDNRYGVPHCLHDQGDHRRRRHADGGARQARSRPAGRGDHAPARQPAGPVGLRCQGHAVHARGQGRRHAAQAADAHRRVRLRHLERGHVPLRRGNRPARRPHRQARRAGRTVGLRPWGALGIRHQHRHGWPHGRNRQRHGPGILPPPPHLRPAGHARHGLRAAAGVGDSAGLGP